MWQDHSSATAARGRDQLPKTQTIYTDGQTIDTPGEYLELPWFKHSLRMASFDAELVVLLASATVNESKFPRFHHVLHAPSIGVVTKVDIAEPRQVSLAGDYLRLAGALEVFEVSAITGEGIEALEARLR